MVAWCVQKKRGQKRNDRKCRSFAIADAIFPLICSHKLLPNVTDLKMHRKFVISTTVVSSVRFLFRISLMKMDSVISWTKRYKTVELRRLLRWYTWTALWHLQLFECIIQKIVECFVFLFRLLTEDYREGFLNFGKLYKNATTYQKWICITS